MSLDQRGESTEVFDAAVGAGTEEHIVDRMTKQFLARLKAHIFQTLLERSLVALRNLVECGDRAVDGNAHTWVRAVSDARLNVSSVVGHLTVEDSVIAGFQCLPIGDGTLPVLTLGRIFLTLDIGERLLVRCYETTAGTHLDGQVAECQTAFHAHVAHHVAGILHEVACSTGGCQL